MGLSCNVATLGGKQTVLCSKRSSASTSLAGTLGEHIEVCYFALFGLQQSVRSNPDLEDIPFVAQYYSVYLFFLFLFDIVLNWWSSQKDGI